MTARHVGPGRLRRLRSSLNSSPWVPPPVRMAVGGRFMRSSDYRLLGTDDAAARRAERYGGWSRGLVVERQDRMWREILGAGGARVDVDNLRSALAAVDEPGASVLEVGCGSAYNADILRSRRYVGCDLSAAAVALARESSPGLPLLRASALSLPFADRALDVVLDGATLMHVPSWRLAVAEQCRIARAAVVLHTVTVTDAAATTYLRKRAYGFTVPEVVINRDALIAAADEAGFTLEQSWPGLDYDLDRFIGIPTTSETWLLRRASSRP